MNFRLKNRPKSVAKIHTTQYTDKPDKTGRYNFWCGNSAHQSKVEIVTDEITCQACVRLVERRKHLQSIKGIT